MHCVYAEGWILRQLPAIWCCRPIRHKGLPSLCVGCAKHGWPASLFLLCVHFAFVFHDFLVGSV